MKKSYIALLFLTSCSSSIIPEVQLPEHPDSGLTIVEVPNVNICEPMTCKDKLYTYCDIRTDECGNTIDCGSCPNLYSCGALDLQGYWPVKNVCGLGCELDKKSTACPKSFPIEYKCKFSKELVEFFLSDQWENKYYCDINYNHTSEKDGILSFCCGL